MALLSGGIAAASDSPDEFQSGGDAGIVESTPERTPGTAPDADGDAGLEAALSGAAAQALDMFNQIRRSNGLAPLRADASLTALAQSWSTHVMNAGTFTTNPDLVLPGYPVPGSTYVEHGVVGNGGPTVADAVNYVAANTPGSILQANVNHIGIGWSVNGSGRVVLYWIAVEYDFNDIGPGDTFYDAVDFLYFYGITTGYPDGGFHPTGTVTREAMAAFLFRFMNDGDPIPACDPAAERLFTDVTAGHPFCGAIEWLAGTGITTGYPDGTFQPGANVSREAMGAFLYRAFVDPVIPACAAGTRRFTDVGTGHPFCGAIEWLATSGITTGWPDGTFRPGISVERQAMAAFLYRVP